MNLGFGFLVYLKASSLKRLSLTFSILAWSGAGWALSVFFIYFFKDQPSMLLWGRMSFTTSGIIPAAFLLFSLFFPQEQRNISFIELVLLFSPTILFFGLSFTDQIVFSIGSGPKMFNYGPFYLPFSIYLTGYILMGLVFLIKTYRKAIGIERLQVKYCLLGMFFTSIPGVVNNLFLPMAGISRFNWLGPPFTMIMLGFTAYSIVKHRLMDINIVLKKGTTYVLLMVLLFVPSSLLVILGQKLFYKEINYLFLAFIFSI
ncbi:MAG: hypothetical protein MUO85_02185, partial [candidate division Zixibacteria bacterium]|nr:hypothetical protein [candidate division Zixibacteria bacterium]